MQNSLSLSRLCSSFRVRDILGRKPNRDIVSVFAESSVVDGLKAMLSSHVGCLIVVDGREEDMVGLVTERDVMLEVAAPRGKQRQICDVMTPMSRIFHVSPEDGTTIVSWFLWCDPNVLLL